MLKLKKYTPESSTDSPCYVCRLFMLCNQSINEDGSIKSEIQNQIRSMWTNEREHITELLSLAIQCKKKYPNCIVKDERVTKHVLVGKFGEERLSADSYGGLIGKVFITTIGSVIMIMILALIVCGIGSLF